MTAHPDLVADTPEGRWQELTDREREVAESAWGRFADWIRRKVSDDEGVEDRELDTEIKRCLDRMGDIGIVRPTLVMSHLAIRNRPRDPHPLVDRVEARLMRWLATIDLYRDCRAHQRWQGIPGRPGPPRTLWEASRDMEGWDDPGLDGAERRWEWSSREMVSFGILEDRPEMLERRAPGGD